MTLEDTRKWDIGLIQTLRLEISGMKTIVDVTCCDYSVEWKIHFIAISIDLFSSNSFNNQSYASWLQRKQIQIKPSELDWSFLEYYRKALDLEPSYEGKKGILHVLRHCEATHDLFTESIKDIYPLIQFDPMPNQELKEPKIELYKISISFAGGDKLITLPVYLLQLNH